MSIIWVEFVSALYFILQGLSVKLLLFLANVVSSLYYKEYAYCTDNILKTIVLYNDYFQSYNQSYFAALRETLIHLWHEVS